MGGKTKSRPAKDLSVAIPSWNTKDLLDQCLESVYKTSAGLDIEIIIVDNASSDGSPDLVSSKYPQIKLVKNRMNLGFAAACNIAFKHSTGRYFLLLNTDTIVMDGALRAMVEFMDAHPDAGVTGCRLLNGDRTLQRSCSKFPGITTELFDALYLSKLFPGSRLFGCYSMSYWDFDDIREVDFAGGSCLIVRREAIEEVGLLDESFFMYTEEADWCYRFWDHGWKVFFFPGAEVVHLGGQSARRYGNDLLLHLYAGRNRFVRKHQGKVSASVHRRVVGLGALGRLFVYALNRPWKPEHRQALRFHFKLLLWSIGGDLESPRRRDTR